MAANTGTLVRILEDINRNSDTFGKQKEERVSDTVACPLSNADWVESNTYCEQDSNSAFTGYKIKVFVDVNPDSSTYRQERTEKTLDEVACPKSSTEAEWILDVENPPYCETKVYKNGETNNTGYYVQTFIDASAFSPTSGQSKVDKTLDLEKCPAPSTEPQLKEISRSCQKDASGNNTGKMEILSQDTNPYSDTYNNMVSTLVDDETNCPKPTTEGEGETTEGES